MKTEKCIFHEWKYIKLEFNVHDIYKDSILRDFWVSNSCRDGHQVYLCTYYVWPLNFLSLCIFIDFGYISTVQGEYHQVKNKSWILIDYSYSLWIFSRWLCLSLVLMVGLILWNWAASTLVWVWKVQHGLELLSIARNFTQTAPWKCWDEDCSFVSNAARNIGNHNYNYNYFSR